MFWRRKKTLHTPVNFQVPWNYTGDFGTHTHLENLRCPGNLQDLKKSRAPGNFQAPWIISGLLEISRGHLNSRWTSSDLADFIACSGLSTS